MRYTEVVGLRLSKTLVERAQRVADVRDQRLSELCRDAIREHVARLERSGGGGLDGQRARTT